MNEILFQYQRVPPTTWVYLSSLMAIALYFKFSRLLTIRNVDLLGLILFGPGLLCVTYGQANHLPGIEKLGFAWLFILDAAFLVRLLLDPLMVRRPLLEPNLSVGGQAFTCVSLLVFLMANVVTSPVAPDDLEGPRMADALRQRQQLPREESSLATYGPGYRFLFLLPSISTHTLIKDSQPAEAGRPAGDDQSLAYAATARTMAILSHLAIVIGLVTIGYRHFDNIKTGIAAATLYLLLPYTAQLTGHVDHALPAALLIWAVERYRRPLASGMLMGLAIGVIYYPAFLLFLWLSFYWQRGLLRFLVGVLSMVALLVGALALTSADLASFLADVRQMFGVRWPLLEQPGGLWQFAAPVYRIPVLAAFVAMCISMAVWPAQKNLGTLMSCSAAVMLGTQFWHAHGGGLYMAWFLPLMLLTIFRPNLEDRVALSVLGEGWLPGRRTRLPRVERAA